MRLRFLSLNFFGFTFKKKFPEVCNLLSEIETKLDDLDHVDLTGFTSFMKIRKCSRYRSGVIVLLIRNELLRYINIIEHVDFSCIIDVNLLKYYSLVQKLVSDNGYSFEISIPYKEKTQTLVRAGLYVPLENPVYESFFFKLKKIENISKYTLAFLEVTVITNY